VGLIRDPALPRPVGFCETAGVLGVIESRVCQLHTRAVLRLRTRLAEHAGA